MLQTLYFVFLEAAVIGILVNRTLYSRSMSLWHLLIYTVLNTVLCSVAVFLGASEYTAILCIACAFVYSVLCFNDSFLRKLTVGISALTCILISGGVQTWGMKILKESEMIASDTDVLARVICISMSICVLCALTVIATNILCGVRAASICMIGLVSFLQLLIFAVIFLFMHSLIDVQLNGLFTVYALVFLLPALTFLYFTESIIFSRKKRRLAKG